VIAADDAQHTLVVYGASDRADAALRRLTGAMQRRGPRVTVLALATQEREASGCCDTRSVLWNRLCRELAQENLARASLAVSGEANVELAVLVHEGRRVAEAVEQEARRREADAIVLADPRACGLSRRERRRLQGQSSVPVSEGMT
jgi:nucleotide-binding universal stress UspA family protein